MVYLLKKRVIGLAPELKFFIICLCNHSGNEGATITIESKKELADTLSVSEKSVRHGLQFLEERGFIHIEIIGSTDDRSSSLKLKLTTDFYNFIAPEVSCIVSNELLIRLENLLNSERFIKLAKRVGAKLFLLTLLAHSDDFGIARNLSIKDLDELMGRFSKDRHRSQLSLLKKVGFIKEYNAGMSGGILLGKQKSEYLINIDHESMEDLNAKLETEAKKLSKHKQVVIIDHQWSDLFVAIRLSGLIGDIQKQDLVQPNVASRINKVEEDLLSECKEVPYEIPAFISLIEITGNSFNGDVRGFQIQRFVSILAMEHLVSSNWEVPTIDHVRENLKFDTLFSDKFLREVILQLIDEKPNPKPLKTQALHYKKLQEYMNKIMTKPVSLPSTDLDHSRLISTITWLISLCVVFTAKSIKKLLVTDEESSPEQTNLAIFKRGKEISLHFF